MRSICLKIFGRALAVIVAGSLLKACRDVRHTNSVADEIVRKTGFSEDFGVDFLVCLRRAESLGFTDKQYERIVEALAREGFKEKELAAMLHGNGMQDFIGWTLTTYYLVHRHGPTSLNGVELLFGSKEAGRLVKLFAEDIDADRINWSEMIQKYRNDSKRS
jgi:hypothetical protein